MRKGWEFDSLLNAEAKCADKKTQTEDDSFVMVLKRCSMCGNLIPKNRLKCSCSAALEEQRKEEEARQAERWEKAKKMPLDEAAARYDFVFVEEWDEFVPVNEIVDRVNEKGSSCPKHVYATRVISLKLDAEMIVEDACEELHEDAFEAVRGEIEGLQKLLDEWSATVEPQTRTYYPDYSVGILLP